MILVREIRGGRGSVRWWEIGKLGGMFGGWRGVGGVVLRDMWRVCDCGDLVGVIVEHPV